MAQTSLLKIMALRHDPRAVPIAGALAIGTALLPTATALSQEYVLGSADVIALDQPRIVFGITDEFAPGGPDVLGPLGTNTALLDTGANGVLLVAGSYAVGEDYGYPLYSFDYDGSGTIDSNEHTAQYAELGVAGATLLDVHDAQGLRILDSSGEELLIGTDLRTFGSEDLNFPGLDAIVGMPAMAGRVVDIDLRSLQDPLNFDFLSTIFYDDISEVAFESATSFNVPLRIIPPEHTDTTLPESLRPTFSGLPAIDGVDLRHTGGSNSGGQTLEATDYSFLVDTGGQLSIFSEDIATDLGIDFLQTLANGGDVIDYIEVGGIGGSALMPIVNIDRLAFPTTDGIDLILTDLQVGILNIGGAPFDAVFGMNMLTSGYLDLLLPTGGGGVLTSGDDPSLVADFLPDGDFPVWFTVQEMIQDGVIGVSFEELSALAAQGLITNDFDDLLQVYTDLYNLEQELGLTPEEPTGPVFDKIVFDFTATDGTALMRLDLHTLKQMGDANGDGMVDEDDLAIVNINFGAFGDEADGDLNGDGIVNDEDLTLVLRNFGQSLPSATDVPEPGSALLLGLGLLCLTQRRKCAK